MELLRTKKFARHIFVRGIVVVLALCANSVHLLSVRADDSETPAQTFERIVDQWAKSREAIVSGVVKSQVVSVGRIAIRPAQIKSVIQKFEDWNGKAEQQQSVLFAILEKKYHRVPPWGENELLFTQDRQRSTITSPPAHEVMYRLPECRVRFSPSHRQVTIDAGRWRKAIDEFPFIPPIEVDDQNAWQVTQEDAILKGIYKRDENHEIELLVDTKANIPRALSITRSDTKFSTQYLQYSPVNYPGGVTLPRVSLKVSCSDGKPGSLKLNVITAAQFNIAIPMGEFVPAAFAMTTVVDNRDGAKKRRIFRLPTAVPDVVAEADARK